MDTYTVLLVDDEEEVIQVIMRKINWEGLGFSVIGYANNGVKALEMVEEFQPDVVMTDIKMPYMDGMELAGHIKADYPATKLLLFTGFDEFEYAKEAVHLEVEEYILKPVNSVELTNVFTQLKIKLDQEIGEKRNAESLKKYYMDSLPLLQANFYATLLEGRIREEELDRYLSDYQISLSGPFFCCLVIHTSSSQIPEDMNPLLLAASVEKQAKEYLGEKWRARCFSYLGKTILIAQLSGENEMSELTDDSDRFCRYAHRIIGANVTVGIGQVCGSILELSQSYSSAREAIPTGCSTELPEPLIFRKLLHMRGITRVPARKGSMSHLFKTIRLNEPPEIAQAVHEYLGSISFKEKSLQQHHLDVMELLSEFCRFAANNDIVLGELSKDMGKLYGRVLDMGPDTLEKWLVNISVSLHEKLLNARTKSTKSFVEKAKDYVHNNYVNEELSLDRICEVLGVSNSYFSTIFKKETGKSFIGYLTDYRMDRASRLLLETNEKSYIIGKKVGYTDPNYFSYVFKRRFGVSPSKYRTEYRESEK